MVMSFSSTRLSAAPPCFHQLAVHIDLAHVVDDDRDPQALAVAQDMVEQRGLARAQEAGEHGDRQASGLPGCHGALSYLPALMQLRADLHPPHRPVGPPHLHASAHCA
jgi:hypothetical protein